MDEKIKVMIIDDSALIRNLVTKMLSENKNIEVVGTAINGKFGYQKINKFAPDVIILDIEMPEMNGIEFLKQKKKLGLVTPVIILSSLAKKGAEITLEALSLGASDFVLKPSEPGSNIEDTKERLIELILGLGKSNSYKEINLENEQKTIIQDMSQIIRNDYEKVDYNKYIVPIKRIPDVQIVAIGISTGGPNALRDILPQIPKNFPVPVVIVQHMPQGFTSEFANSLDKICNIRVKEAADGDILTPGRILIAPGGIHLKLEKKSLATIVKLDNSNPVNGHKPSCDVLFQSVVDCYGSNSLGCIMTGMGRDGADKIGSIMKSGGITIGQDQDSSVVYGMPHVALKNCHLNIVKPLNEIMTTIINIVMNKRI